MCRAALALRRPRAACLRGLEVSGFVLYEPKITYSISTPVKGRQSSEGDGLGATSSGRS